MSMNVRSDANGGRASPSLQILDFGGSFHYDALSAHAQPNYTVPFVHEQLAKRVATWQVLQPSELITQEAAAAFFCDRLLTPGPPHRAPATFPHHSRYLTEERAIRNLWDDEEKHQNAAARFREILKPTKEPEWQFRQEEERWRNLLECVLARGGPEATGACAAED